MLTVEGIDVYYGNLQALKNVSLRVGKGEIVSLIGANGAGKSTTLRAVSGILAPRSGTIRFMGREISGLPPHRVARQGVAHVPEGRGIFSNMSVLENLMLGADARGRGKDPGTGTDKVFSVFPRLAERKNQMAGTLSGGEQQMLAIGRALMADPSLMLLDEPSMGLSPLLVEEIFRMITEVNRAGATILLVEQNASMALSVAARAYVLEAGTIVLEGETGELRNDPGVQAAYLGDV